MSETAAPSESLAAQAPSRSSVGPIGALGIALGLLAIAGSITAIAWTRSGAIDGAALIASSFDVGALPFELRVARASKLASGERSVVLEPPSLAPEPPRAPAPEPTETPPTSSTPSDGDPPRPRFDGSKIALGEAGRPPRQVVLVAYSDAFPEGAVNAQFQGVEWKDLRDLPVEGTLAAVDAGKLDWGDYRADFVHERLFEPGGTFRDRIRVNLSAPGLRWAMHALWGRGLPASKERVGEILKALRTRPTG